MLVTEEQAKEMWCPAARVITARNRQTHNRWADDEDSQPTPVMCCCIASPCMWWRWAETTIEVTYGTKFDKKSRYYDAKPADWADCVLIEAGPTPGGSYRYVLARRSGDANEDTSWMLGYCGLAGKP